MKVGVLQIIDSLDVGGAEKVAVVTANNLDRNKFNSYLVATRKKGKLESEIDPNVTFLHLKKKSILDIFSLVRLLKFVKKNNIYIIHAHSSSVYTSALLKLVYPRVKLIWHDHYGIRLDLRKRDTFFIKLASYLFNFTIVVNDDLLRWSKDNLRKSSKIKLIFNASVFNKSPNKTILKGSKGKRIIFLAGLRVQKNHFNGLVAMKYVLDAHKDATLHLIGKSFEDHYAEAVFQAIEDLELTESVYYYGIRMDVENLLKQADIGILSSDSEGLPLTLIEYGLAGLPMVSTDVGDCHKVIGNKSYVVEWNNPKALSNKIITLLNDEKLMKEVGKENYQRVNHIFGIDTYIDNVQSVYKILMQ